MSGVDLILEQCIGFAQTVVNGKVFVNVFFFTFVSDVLGVNLTLSMQFFSATNSQWLDWLNALVSLSEFSSVLHLFQQP